MTTREVNTGLPLATRRTLRQIAGSLGCTSSRGAYAGEGSITELLRGIADGRVVCVKAQDYEDLTHAYNDGYDTAISNSERR
jgi:hypothetical protein